MTGKLIRIVSLLPILIALSGCGGGGGGSGAGSGAGSGSTPPAPTQATLQWTAPAAISYGTALGSTQLDATSSTQGTFSYSPASGTVLTAGTHTLTATFTPNGSTSSSTVTTTITVNKATPTITWATPAPVAEGAALSSTQLDASTSVAGTFAYSPAAGTTMSTAGNQTLSATFTPADSTDYASAQASVTLVVNAANTASVSIDVSSPMGSVPSLGYGVDTAVYDGYMTNPGLGASLKTGGFNAIRYPGGSYADIFNFISDSNQTLNAGGYFAPGDTFNNWISDLIQPSGAKGVITVNYGSNQTNDGPAPVSEAASWVQDADITHDYGILYWEIGNEIYGNGYYTSGNWEYDLHDLDQTASARVGNAALSPTAYGTNAAAFIKAMKAVDPNIKCGVFVSTSPWVPNWDQDVLSAVSSGLQGSGYTLDFVILHWYPSGSDAQVLAAPATIGSSQVALVRADIQKYYALPNASQLQLLVTETAASSNGGIFPYLFTTDEFLTWFEQGASNVEYQELNSGVYQNSASNTPIGPWYGVSFDSTIARPGDRMVAASSTNPLLRVHGVRRSDGQVGVVLINDDPGSDTTVSVSVSGATLASTGTEYTFGNADFATGSQTPIQGISSSSITGVGNNFTVTVPAYSTVAVVIPQSSTDTATLIANGNYAIANSQTGLMLDDTGASKTAGTLMDMMPANGGGNQLWTLTNLGNNFVELVSVNSGLALEVAQGSMSSGAQIDQQPWSDSSSQIWKVVSMGGGNYELLSQHSSLALGVPAATSGSGSSALLNGTGLDQETVTGAADQLWSFYN
jgi:hypothetical protein